MKKLITLLLAVAGYVGTASAWSSAVLHYEGKWNSDDVYFTKIDGNQFYIQMDGSVINNGSFYFRFAVKGDSDGDTFTEKEPDTTSHDVDQEVTSTAVTCNYNSWSGDSHTTKAWYIAQDAKADKVDIYLKYAKTDDSDDTSWTWHITAVPLYKRTIYWDNSETSSWTTVKAYTYDENLGNHRKIEDLGAWSSVSALSADTDGKYSVNFYGTSTVKAIFYNGGSDSNKTGNLSVTNNGIYKGTSATEPNAIRAAVSSVGYATFSCTKDVDFSTLTSTVKAKKAAVDSNGKITYTEVSTVPAGEGVLLESVSGDAVSLDVPVATSTPSANEGNQFVAIDETFQLAQSSESGYTNFILSKVDNVLGFYKVNSSGSWCAAGTAYLKVANSSVPSARGFFPIWDDATSIKAIQQEQTLTGEAYNLAGQRVTNPTKGLYIVNGKKIIKK